MRIWPKKRSGWRRLGFLTFVFLVVLLWWGPPLELHLLGVSETVPRYPELLDQFRETWAKIAGGFAVLAGVWMAWERLEVRREGQVTDRFTRAIDQLGDDELEVRIGGIYALERIAQDSPKDHWSVMEVLTALIRERSRSSDGEMVDRSGDWKASPLGGEQRDEEGGEEVAKDDDTWRWPPQHRMAEVQAALTVIGRRDREPEEDLDRRLDLAAADLRDADLANCNLDRTNFTGADLRGANLSGASVQDCTMVDTDFTGAVLWDTDLSESVLQGADFSETVLGGETTFDGVYFGNVQGLSPNDLEKLEGYEEAELPEEWKEKVDAEQSES